jgi:hypothetical protein
MQAHGKYLFTGIENVKGYFVFDIAPIYEIEYPWRICNFALYVHIWPRKALVFGWWKNKKTSVDQHLLDAMRGRVHEAKKELPVGIQSERL